MARKKPTRKPQGPKQFLQSAPTTAQQRNIEAALRQLTSNKGLEDTPLQQAQRLIEQAYVPGNTIPVLELAQQALAICPDCADAYVLMAEQTPNHLEKVKLYGEGVHAGSRALGPAFFGTEQGRFWMILETRPYMRARQGLALALWQVARHKESVDHLQDLLKLNPLDNQGNRYHLAQWLLFLDRDTEVRQLLESYPEEASCIWAYTSALLIFRAEGDTIAARRSLKLARKANPHVPDFIRGNKEFPQRPPQSYRLGDSQEAIYYAQNFLFGWKFTEGAISWLRQESLGKSRKPTQPPAQGPEEGLKKSLRALPQEVEDIWQVGLAQMPEWMKIGDTMVRPWVLLVASTTHELVLAHELFDESPSTDHLWDGLVKAIRHPLGGDSHRPGQILLRTDPGLASLRPHLEAIALAVGIRENLTTIDQIFADMCEHLGTEPRPGLLDCPGIHIQQVARFFQAADQFYRESLWKKVPMQHTIQVTGDRLPDGPYHATIMGQSGLTIGLSLTQTNLKPDHRTAPTGLCLMYGEEWDIPVADRDAIRENDWPIARSDAYPHLFYTGPDNPMRPPSPEEMELFTACLQQIPELVRGEMKVKKGRKNKEATPKKSDTQEIHLTWMQE